MRYPSEFTIDIMGSCNLSCKYCAQGQGMNHQPMKRLSVNGFKKIIRSILPVAQKITFSNWSEPFLNKDIFEIVKHIKSYSRHIVVGTSSNANHFTEDMADRLIDSDMDWLFISMSGTTNEIYRRYHQNGDVHKIYQTLKYISDAKKRRNSEKPDIHIGYLQFPFNYTSLRTFRRSLEEELDKYEVDEKFSSVVSNYGCLSGSNLSLADRIRLYGDTPVADSPLYLKYECTRIFNQPAIRCDGTVFPCCAVSYDKDSGFGNLFEETFEAIWNSQRYREFRDSFRKNQNAICNDCTLFYPLYKFDLSRDLPYQIQAKLWWGKSLLKQCLMKHRLMPSAVSRGSPS